MSTSAITNAVAGYVQRVVSGGTPQAGSSAMEEAKETLAATRQEAAHGDRAAIAKLARLKQAQELANPAPNREPGKGEMVDHQA